LLILIIADGTFQSLLLLRILWGVRHVLAAQDVFLLWTVHAFGSRWASINERLPIVAGNVIRVILAKFLTRHIIAFWSGAWSGCGWSPGALIGLLILIVVHRSFLLWCRVIVGSAGRCSVLPDFTAQHLLECFVFLARGSRWALTIDQLSVVADGVSAVALAVSVASVEGSAIRSASVGYLKCSS
jgi:hypothetical protein